MIYKAKARAAFLLAALLIFIILGSSAAEAAEAEHDCSGEDCAVCMCLRSFEDAKAKLGAQTELQTFTVEPVFNTEYVKQPLQTVMILHTPVSDKVRLDN